MTFTEWTKTVETVLKILFCVLQKKESQGYESEHDDGTFFFFYELSLQSQMFQKKIDTTETAVEKQYRAIKTNTQKYKSEKLDA